MSNDPRRQVWVMAASLAATAVLSFAIGVMATVWSYSVPIPPAPSQADAAGREAAPAAMALEPATPVSAPEAAALAPEIFGGMWAGAPLPPHPSAGLGGPHVVALGDHLRPDQAEQARRLAEGRGLRAVVRLVVDGSGRAWYQVEAGDFPDRIAAELAARELAGDAPVAMAVPRPVARSDWSRG